MRDRSIFLTNDDGLEEGNVQLLAEVLIKHGYKVSAVIPNHNRSGVGGSHFQKGVYQWDIIKNEPYQLYTVDGDPVDCIEFARSIFEDFDLVIAGINRSYNVGLSINSSGTVQAAVRAYGVGLGKRMISISSNSTNDKKMINFVPKLLDHLIKKKFYSSKLLNINVPSTHNGRFKQTKLEHDLRKIYKYPLLIDRKNKAFSYPVELQDSRTLTDEETDLSAVNNNLISITKLYEKK